MKNEINTIESNYQASFVASKLLNSTIDLNNLFLIRKPCHSKSLVDIKKVRYNFNEYLHVLVNKNGIYDNLPEGIFHQAQAHKNIPEVLEDMRKQQMREFNARKYFSVFEVEIDRCEVINKLQENCFDDKANYPDFVNMFSQYWPFIKLMSVRQALIFTNIIPVLYAIRQNIADMAKCYSLILEVPVSMAYVNLSGTRPQMKVDKLDEMRLGVDFVLGTSFDDRELDLCITLGPMSVSDRELFLSEQPKDIILRYLSKVFLPAKLLHKYVYKTNQKEAAFILGSSRLEVNTTLG